MNYRERITSDHKIMLGKPVVKGTRITVEIVLRKMAEGASQEDILKMYDQLTPIDIQAILGFASEVIGSEKVIMSE